jgi:hypothetical protein
MAMQGDSWYYCIIRNSGRDSVLPVALTCWQIVDVPLQSSPGAY